MSQNNIKQIHIQSRTDTRANWVSENPKLLDREIGYEREEGKYKIGDGVTHWNDLPYASPGSEIGKQTPEGGEIFNDYENNQATNSWSHAEGRKTSASGQASHTEGYLTQAEGTVAHAEGYETCAKANSSHAEGYKTLAAGLHSHAEGYYTNAYGGASHAEGGNTKTGKLDASNNYIANTGTYAHAEGHLTQAEGECSHTEGLGTKALGQASHAEGYHTTIETNFGHVSGTYNKTTNSLFVIGNGKENEPSDAFTLDWGGNAWFQGEVKVGSEALPLVTKKLVDNKFQVLEEETLPQLEENIDNRFQILEEETLPQLEENIVNNLNTYLQELFGGAW